MATKTPIISTNVGGLKAILKNGYNSIIIREKNVKDICDKIKMCIQNGTLREEIAQNAYYDVLKKFDVRQINKKIEKILFVTK